MMLKDFYQILNLSRDASAEDIKRAFRRLAMQYHPDRNPKNALEAAEKFKEINEAYEVLGDEVRRWQYDRLTSYPGGAMPVQDIFSNNMEPDISEILRKYAGMGFIVRGMGWGRPWGCGRRQGGQCRRQWRQDIE
jgi:curved DNA-binding protein CbpA